MPRIKRIIFHQYSPKIKLFLKKKRKIFKRWGLGSQTPVPPAAGALPLDPQTEPPIANFWLRVCHTLHCL